MPIYKIKSDNKFYENNNIFGSEQDAWLSLLEEAERIYIHNIKNPHIYYKTDNINKKIIFFCGGTEWFGLKRTYNIYDCTFLIIKENIKVPINKETIDYIQRNHFEIASKIIK